MTLVSGSPDETLSVGERLGRSLRANDVIALVGELGAGKTLLVKGIAKGMGIGEETPVTSPSYILMNEYPGPLALYHFDFYRLARVEDALGIGCDEYFEAGGVCVVEWADRFPELFEEATARVTIVKTGETERRIEVEPKEGAGLF